MVDKITNIIAVTTTVAEKSSNKMSKHTHVLDVDTIPLCIEADRLFKKKCFYLFKFQMLPHFLVPTPRVHCPLPLPLCL